MKCPGQDMQYWKPGDIFDAVCPRCGGSVEFFKDDPARRCGACGHRFANPKMDFGCAAYCPYAEQCLGDLPPELVAQQEHLFKDRLALEVKRRLGGDFRRIGRATRSARYGEQLAKAEGGNLAVVLSAVYLKEIDGGSGKVEAVDLLRRLKASEALVDGVAAILEGIGSAAGGASLEARIVHDADRLGDLEARLGKGALSPVDAETDAAERFLTPTGAASARRLLASAEE